MFRVRAQNKAGVGKASETTEPVTAVTKPGTTPVGGGRCRKKQKHFFFIHFSQGGTLKGADVLFKQK